MTKHKIKWKDVYFDIARTLLRRGGGGAIGHHTLPIRGITRRLHLKYSPRIIEEGIDRLVKKEDLLLWPKTAEKLDESSSVSINPKRLDDLEKYLKGHPKWYQRLKDIEEEMKYKKHKMD